MLDSPQTSFWRRSYGRGCPGRRAARSRTCRADYPDGVPLADACTLATKRRSANVCLDARTATGAVPMTYTESLTRTLACGTPETPGIPPSSPPSPAAAPLQDEIYLRYRRPLMQVFLQRRIDRDAAQDLLQRTFLQAIKKIRSEGLDDPSNLGGYLYRTACKLATAYWRGELSRRHDSDGELLSNLQDDALSLEESLDHDLRAKCVRELMAKLPVPRDREVLERFYLREEPRVSIRESMKLTELQFNQVLVAGASALRRRFCASRDLPGAVGKTLTRWMGNQHIWITFTSRRTRPPPLTSRTSSTSTSQEAFEIHMMGCSECLNDVESWRVIKTHMPDAVVVETARQYKKNWWGGWGMAASFVGAMVVAGAGGWFANALCSGRIWTRSETAIFDMQPLTRSDECTQLAVAANTRAVVLRVTKVDSERHVGRHGCRRATSCGRASTTRANSATEAGCCGSIRTICRRKPAYIVSRRQ